MNPESRPSARGLSPAPQKVHGDGLPASGLRRRLRPHCPTRPPAPTTRARVLLRTCCSLCPEHSSTGLCLAELCSRTPSSSSGHRPPLDVSYFAHEFAARPPLPPHRGTQPLRGQSRRYGQDSTWGPGPGKLPWGAQGGPGSLLGEAQARSTQGCAESSWNLAPQLRPRSPRPRERASSPRRAHSPPRRALRAGILLPEVRGVESRRLEDHFRQKPLGAGPAAAGAGRRA